LSRLYLFILRKKTIALESKQYSYLRLIFYNNLLFTRKTFIVKREKNSLLCLIDYLLFIAFYNNVFVIKSTRDISYIFRVKLLFVKKSFTLKIKINTLNQLIFRKSKRNANKYCISKTKMLRSSI